MKPRPGFALVVTLMLALALAVAAIGLLLAGTQEALIAVTVERLAATRVAAEDAAVASATRWSTRAMTDLPVGATRPDSANPMPRPPVADVSVSTSRLAPELFLIRATATAAGGSSGVVTSRAGLLVRILDPARLIATAPGAVTAEGSVTVSSGLISGEDECGDSAAVPGVVGGPVAAPPGSVTGKPPVAGPTPPHAGLDPLASPVLDGLSTVPAPGTATPAPVQSAGGCRVGPSSWGALDLSSPCHGALPLVHAAGDLTMAGGVGRGILVVEGDLRMTDSARFEGLVVVRGNALLEGGAQLSGALRTSSLDLIDGRVLRNSCALAAAASAPSLDRAFRAPSRWWVPAF